MYLLLSGLVMEEREEEYILWSFQIFPTKMAYGKNSEGGWLGVGSSKRSKEPLTSQLALLPPLCWGHFWVQVLTCTHMTEIGDQEKPQEQGAARLHPWRGSMTDYRAVSPAWGHR